MSTKISQLPIYVGLLQTDGYVPVSVLGVTYKIKPNQFVNTSGGTVVDVYVTGGTYNQSSGIATFTNNFGTSFSVEGFASTLNDVTANDNNSNQPIIVRDISTSQQSTIEAGNIHTNSTDGSTNAYMLDGGVVGASDNNGNYVNLTPYDLQINTNGSFVTSIKSDYLGDNRFLQVPNDDGIIALEGYVDHAIGSVGLQQVTDVSNTTNNRINVREINLWDEVGNDYNGNINFNNNNFIFQNLIGSEIFRVENDRLGLTNSAGFITYISNIDIYKPDVIFKFPQRDTGTYTIATTDMLQYFITDAPYDGNVYGRKNGGWSGIVIPTDTYVTGGTYSNGTATFKNNSGGIFSVTGFSTGYTLTSNAITTTLGYTPYNSTNPNGYISGITSDTIISALGYTPYNAANPSSFISGITRTDVTSALGYTPLSAYTDTYVVGGSYSAGTASYRNNTGGTFSVSGFSTPQLSAVTIDSYLGTRLNPIDSSLNGFMINKSINGVVGFQARNTDTGSTYAYASIAVGGAIIPDNYSNVASMNFYGANYYRPELRNTSGIYSTVPFKFVGLNSSDIQFRTGVFGSETTKLGISSGGTISIGVTPSTDNSGSLVGRNSNGDLVLIDKNAITSGITNTYVPYSGANGDVNINTHNFYGNTYFNGFTTITASTASTITLTINSTPVYLVTGSGGQTIQLPNATTLPNGSIYSFNNNQSSGVINVNNNSGTLVKSVASGAYLTLELIDNTTPTGLWDAHFEAPSNANWSTNTLDWNGSIINATWNGTVVQPNRGGTGQSTYTNGQILIGNSGNTLTKATLTAGNNVRITNGSGSISIDSDNTYVTGGTYNNGTATFINNSGNTFNVTGFTTPFTGGTVSGVTTFTNGLSATTINDAALITLQEVMRAAFLI